MAEKKKKEPEKEVETILEPEIETQQDVQTDVEVEVLEEVEIDLVQKELDETKQVLLRTAAEYDNFRKRSAKEKENSFNNGVSHASSQMISVLDTLEFAINAETSDEIYKKGVIMIGDKANEVFASLGIVEIEALGKEFDPETMAAVSQQEPQENEKSGDVVKVFQKGYTLNGKVIRHVSVVVAI